MSGISGKAKIAGVIGWPIRHSLSPRLHGYWLDQYNIDGSFIPLPVEPSDLGTIIPALPRMGFHGVNVTLPHKETVMAHLDHIHETARRIGAVNTIIFDQDGQSTGHNTDGFGFTENILQTLIHWDFPQGPVVVLGAGGASRAICVALLDAGVPEIRLLNRTHERARVLASEINNVCGRGDSGGTITVVDWDRRSECLGDVAMVVNTTTLGMTGKPPLEIDISGLPEQACVTDIVYAPLKTALLVQAEQCGCAIVDGLGMLLHQARPGFEAWFGPTPQVTEDLRRHVLSGAG